MGPNSLGLLKEGHEILSFEVQCPWKYLNYIRGGDEFGTFHISDNEEIDSDILG